VLSSPISASKKSGLQGATQTCVFVLHCSLLDLTPRIYSGGGAQPNKEMNSAAVPVLWMGNEALLAGLRLTASKVNWDWDQLKDTSPRESLVHVWRLFEVLPFKRLSYADKKDTVW
jgi:hypothetical protein